MASLTDQSSMSLPDHWPSRIVGSVHYRVETPLMLLLEL
jgi:hypothetical protein